MKKLEDIPKKNLFQVPDGYFDRLPGVIQSRVATEELQPAWSPFARLTLKYALPALVMVAALFYLQPGPATPEELLATIDSAELVAYLDESEMATEELLEAVSLDADDIEAIELGSLEDMELSDEEAESLFNELEN